MATREDSMRMTQETDAKQGRTLLRVLLLLTAALALAWSAHRDLNQDEAFVFQTDTVATLRQLVEVQLHFPISLDPLFYHLLGFLSVKLFGATTFAVRLPSIVGFLLMQVCLFAYVRRIAGGFAGFVAAWVPAITATLFYAQQTRPYGVLLGLSALALLAYQHSIRDQVRTRWLVTLAVALLLALNSHYFAILLLIPLYGAGLVRMVALRRIDLPLIVAIAAGSAGELLTLPFQPAASQFRRHYYNAGRVTFHAVTQSYRSLFVSYTGQSQPAQHLILVMLSVAALVLLAALVVRARSRDLHVPIAEQTFLVLLSSLPFFGFVLAKYVTHSIEVRYILPAMIGVAALIALAALPLYSKPQLHLPLAAVCLVWLVVEGTAEVRRAHIMRDEDRAHALFAAPPGDAPIYVQNMGNFNELAQIIPDGHLRSRMSLVYSAPYEIEIARHDTQSLTAEHMRHFTHFNIARYEDLRAQPGQHLFLVYPQGSGWDWLLTQLQRDHATMTPLGPALQGELVSVTFPQGMTSALDQPRVAVAFSVH